ncbi:MAG: gltP [Rickettsiaceae bacterium]|jgi:Na+/H+-dicarboxylate symporter|nr:gltP [Rickettsiaceae bacterium]
MKLWHKVTLGLILGILCGIIFGEKVESIKIVGLIFLRIITMVIAPLIFFSLVSGLTSMSDPGSLGRVGIKATFAFLITTFFAVVFGLSIALILEPGVGVNIHFGSDDLSEPQKAFDFADFLLNIVPANAIGSLAEGKILQVVFFAIFTGITLNKMGSSANQIKSFFNLMSKMVFKMMSMIVELSPYGAFSLTAWVVGTQGLGIIYSLWKLMCAIVIAMFLQYLIFGLLIMIFCRISPIPFYKKSFEYQILAFSTSSSKVALPTTMQICRNRLGISDASTSFILPLGASINMDGFAINLALCTIFFAQVLGVSLHLHDYLIIVLMATIGSIGGAGIPGASMFMLPIVLSAVNLPTEGVAILAGIDRILDMLRTTINITGDATITLIIDDSEGSFDKEKYYS